MIYMRDKRAIIIKDSRLKKIRDNLRDVIIQAYHIHWKKLFDEMDKISRDVNGRPRSVRKLSLDEKKRFRELQELQSGLSNSLDRSILTCVACGKGHRDMVYNKAYRAWYCTECYGMERLSAQKRAKVKKRAAKSHEEETIESHSKTFL